MMAAGVGAMDRRVKLKTPTESQDDHGGLVLTYALLQEVWAEVRPLRGKEFLEAAQVVAGGEVEFKIYWRNDIDERARIEHDGVDYEILHIAEVGRRNWLRILAKKP